jgi:hypothetical protein
MASFAGQQVLDKDPTVWLYKAIEVKKRKEGISLKSGLGKKIIISCQKYRFFLPHLALGFKLCIVFSGRVYLAAKSISLIVLYPK